MAVYKFFLEGEEVHLSPHRALYFAALKTLVISDLHLGKINHFRKAGINVPSAANQSNTETLIELFIDFKPERVIFIGDLFHSSYNSEWEVLGQVLNNFKSCSFELVPGNHDIMGKGQYLKHNILWHEQELSLTKRITLVHEPTPSPKKSKYYISGHIHPAITISGRGRQSLTFPCFWFGQQQALLPAFGVFTGMKSIKCEEGDKVFAIANKKVMDVSLPKNSILLQLPDQMNPTL